MGYLSLNCGSGLGHDDCKGVYPETGTCVCSCHPKELSAEERIVLRQMIAEYERDDD